MTQPISRRDFVKSSLAASAVLPLALGAQTTSTPPPAAAAAAPREELPKGKIANQEFSRLMMGGNLIGGWSHSRELSYVSTLMRRYNTPAKIRETLEAGESNGITAINTWVMDDNSQIFEHWKNGGKMKWFAQARLDSGSGFSQFQRAIDEGAVGVHITGDTAEGLLSQKRFEKVVESVQYLKEHKRIAGVAAHDLKVIVECEKLKLDVDFYQKTFHALDYYTAPRADETGALGAHDNSWCQDPPSRHRRHGQGQEALDRLQDSRRRRAAPHARVSLCVQQRGRLHPRWHVRLADCRQREARAPGGLDCRQRQLEAHAPVV